MENQTQWANMTDRTYSLVFLLDESEIEQDALRKKAAKAVGQEHWLNLDPQVVMMESQVLKLSFEGSLEEIDDCHRRINENLAGQHSCILLRDEAGLEIRQQAYPVLARTEEELRGFVKRAMTEMIGIDWWERLTPKSVRESVQEIKTAIMAHGDNISKKRLSYSHPVDLLTFKDLFAIVSGSVQQWADDRPLSPIDLRELLDDSSSIEDITEKLTEKTDRVSLWDEVFSQYFESEELRSQWGELAQAITRFVIPRRHEVMHHQTIHLSELQRLKEIYRQAHTLISTAKRKLSAEELVKAREKSQEWMSILMRAMEQQAAALGAMGRLDTTAMSARFFEHLGSISPLEGFLEQQAAALGAMGRIDTTAMSARFFEHLGSISLLEGFLEQQAAALGAMGRIDTTAMVARIFKQIDSLSLQERVAEQHSAALRALGHIDMAALDQERQAPYVGSSESVRFHLPSCRFAQQILVENAIGFESRKEALVEGYVPCGACRP
jgi:hypothetical protein